MIRIGLGTNKSLVSRLIRWATNSDVSHAWIEYESEALGGSWVMHSWGHLGVVIVPLRHVRRDYPTYKLYRTRLDLSIGFIWAQRYISAPYDFGVIWNGILLVLHRATKWEWLNKLIHRNASKFSCSEFVAALLQAANVPGTEALDPELTTPGKLESFCSTSPHFMMMRR